MIKKLFSKKNTNIEDFKKLLLKKPFNSTSVYNFFISKKININKLDEYHNTYLDQCLMNGCFKAASWLLKQNIKISISNKVNASTVRLAIESGAIEVISDILEYSDFDINSVDESGRSLLQDAIIFGQHEIADKLLDNNIDINIKDKYNRNVAFDAIAYGENKIVDKIITIDGLELNNIDTNGHTVLNNKKVLEDDEVAKKLLQNGADPTICDTDGYNFITHAALRGEDGEEILDVALEEGCDINAKLEHHNSVLMEVMYAFTRVTDGELKRRSELRNVATKLIDYGSDINDINSDNETILFDMVRKNDIEGCAFLLEKGIDVNHKNKSFETPLFIAVLQGINSLDLILLLLQKNADPTIRNKHSQTIPEILNNIILHIHNLNNINDPKLLEKIAPDGKYMLILKEIISVNNFEFDYLDSMGNPLFFMPCVYGDMRTVKLYLNCGLNINLKNKNGHNIFYEYVFSVFIDNEYFPEFRENLVFLLISKADINATDKQGQTIYSKVALMNYCNLKLFRKLIEVTRHDYSSVDKLGRTIIHSCVFSNNTELLKLVYGVQRNIQNIPDKFNILPITYAAVLGSKDLVIELLNRDTNITSGKDIPEDIKKKFKSKLKNINNLTKGIKNPDDFRKLEIFQKQILKDLS